MATKINVPGNTANSLDNEIAEARRLWAWERPDWFLEEVLGCPRYVPGSGVPGYYDKQLEIMESVKVNRRTAVCGANGTGKDWGSGRDVLWWIYCHEDAMVIVYGPTGRQVNEIIWKESRIAFKGAVLDLPGYMFPSASKYVVTDRRQAQGFSAQPGSRGGSGIQGFHSGHMLEQYIR